MQKTGLKPVRTEPAVFCGLGPVGNQSRLVILTKSIIYSKYYIYIYILNNYLERWNGVEGVGMGMSWRVVEGVGEWKHLLCRTALLTRIEDGSGAAAAAVQRRC